MKEQKIYQNFEGILKELKASFELSVAEEIKEVGGDIRRHLVFFLGNESFSLPIKQLREILSDKPIIPVPDAPSSIHGVINYKNRILSVTNIHHLLQLKFNKKDSSCLLVTRGNKYDTALLVDSLTGLIDVNQTDIKPGVSGQKESMDKLIAGEIYFQKKLITLLDLAGIS